MRVRWLMFVMGLCALGSGCHLFHYAARTLIDAPIECFDECLAKRRNRQWAKAAWNNVVRCDQAKGYSEDYECGFLDGFTDYLDSGGSQLPVVPPMRYRRASDLSPVQYQAAEDWFAGFRHGVAVARGTGLRMWNTVPTSGEAIQGYIPRQGPAHPIDVTPVEPAHPLPFPRQTPAPEQIPAITAPSYESQRYGEPTASPYHVMLRPPRPGWDLVSIPSADQ